VTVNPTDLGFRPGGRALPPGLEPVHPRHGPGRIIEQSGPDVASWQAGDRVLAVGAPAEPGRGAQAENRVVDVDQLAKVLNGWSLTDAAALPMIRMTVRTASTCSSCPRARPWP
jgi:NADPH:quinone reductase-like Zn-dependent oxidoreductase